MATTLSNKPPVSPIQKRSDNRAGMTKAQLIDWIFKNSTLFFALSTIVLILSVAFTLYSASRMTINDPAHHFSLTNRVWDPVAPDESKPFGNLFGAMPFIYGTIITSLIAMLIAVPLGVGAAIFLSEISPRWLNTPISFLVELLAAVPSIVYGFWALKYIVPLFSQKFEPWLAAHFGSFPFFSAPADGFSGQDYLVAGLVLALMVLPFITAISRDVLRSVPNSQREASYGMGATKWETISGAVLRSGSSGIIGASMLGLGRALGETMAVTIVIGSATNLPIFGNAASFSLMRPGYTMSSMLADQYPNPTSPIHSSALTEIALILFLVTIVVNSIARGLVWLTATKTSGTASKFSRNAKSAITNIINYGMIALFAGLILLQTYQDIKARGIGAIFGVAELLGLAVLALFLFNQWVPGKPIFLAWRKFTNYFALSACGLCVLIASGALLTLLGFVAHDGFGALNPQFFKLPDAGHPEAGGMLHAIIGTGLLVFFASLFGIPFGILGGLFLAEFGNNWLGGVTRFAADLLNGVPSIVIGIFAYAAVVYPTTQIAWPKPFSYFIDHGSFGTAGAFALGIMMIPTVMRTTEELVRLVPMSLREGSLALGATHAITIWKVVLPTARSGIITGALLAVARVAGETAPLLMVLCNSSILETTLSKRVASLPVQIYVLRDEPSQLALQQSWGVALVLVILVLVFSIMARIFTRAKLRTTV